MMQKINFIKESDIERLVSNIVNEALPKREKERHQTNWKKKSFDPYQREDQIMSAFGSYSGDIPPAIISYLRKNPRLFFKRMAEIYGVDKILEFIGYSEQEKGEEVNEGFIYEDVYGSVEEVEDFLMEAEYQGRKVQLGKIMQGDIKKFKVYVKNDKGKVVKVNFGFGGKSAKGKRMVIKKNNPERRRSFRARMNCDNPGPRWKPRYWACKTW